VFDELDVPPEQFRDPLLIPAKTWTIDTAALESPTRRFTLAHRGETWWLTAPIEDRAERSEVGGWLNRAGEIRIERFVDDAPQVEKLTEWGLQMARAELALKKRDAAGPVTVFFGAAVPGSEALVYAKRSDEPAIYAVAASDVEALLIDPTRLRSRACFEYFTSQVGKLAVRSGESQWTVLKQDGRWTLEGSEEPLDPTRVEQVLNTAADLRIEAFVSDDPASGPYGVEPPQGSITVWVDVEETPQRLAVGHAAQGAVGRYATIDGRQSVVRIPEAVMPLLATTADSLRRAPPAAPDGTPQVTPGGGPVPQ
jgi:hypothetical protein